MRPCVNDVRKGRQFLRRPMYRPAIPTAPKCDFGAGTQVDLLHYITWVRFDLSGGEGHIDVTTVALGR